MAPLRVSTTKSEWLPDDPTAFVPTSLWKLPFITTWDDSRNQNRPTDSAEEAKYYSRPTASQVISAAEMIFVDRIDVGAEALRSPEEIGRMLKDAEGKLGALTEVFGGTCVIGNMCPAKFACVGCAGNAPDPAKRYQICLLYTSPSP